MENLEKLPPQAPEMEINVLGAMLIDREAAETAFEILQPGDFYRDAHRRIFQAAREIYEQTQALDHAILTDALEARGVLAQVGGLAYVAELVDAVPTSAHVEEYARIVKDRSRMRGLITAGTNIVRAGFEPGRSADEVLAEADAELLALAGGQGAQGVTGAELARDLGAEFNTSGHAAAGLLTGVEIIDEALGGARPGELIILAARPKVGKTTTALNILGFLGRAGVPAVMFSLEMSRRAIGLHLLRQQTGFDYFRRKPQGPDLEAARAGLAEIARLPVTIEDRGRGLASIRARARRAVGRNGARMILVDYLQRIDPPPSFRDESQCDSLGHIVSALKSLATDAQVPVVALCQLNRQSEKRDNKRPHISDLRGSGRIEEEADAIILLHRPNKGRAVASGGDDGMVELRLTSRNTDDAEDKAWLDAGTGLLYPGQVERDMAREARGAEKI